ncbi:MAG TPA: hypothetical protein VGO53_07395 [Steroidobacteraceae bacterium]|nr:hypothetical protein [Steroidobacteraceae bacterium]
MKSLILFLVVATTALSYNARPALAADVVAKVPATARAVQAADLIERSRQALVAYVAGVDSDAKILNLWIFPTGDANAVYVHYDTLSTKASPDGEGTQGHLALVEMRGDRIVKMQDFTASPPAMVANAAPQH